ncbi:hypothetical protein K8Z61_08195 [Nocardioides sp. TRM66260-LWL]|uniref:hypothetical protein n=1 Tax=Nocardioides sp. TRM66260-LWL TaxID=2874478 RepID=UPI001CC66D47|nr:hypothetical protein [Nocardioides sp. TRM66260-LWL]MBZ5734476.1 hypothetical protein [Nocardioides sp. TRM66260-LWL]
MRLRTHVPRPRPRLVAAAIGGLMALGVLAPPGSAATGFSVSIGAASDPAPGRLSVQVTTDAPYVRATLAPFEGSEAQLAPQVVAVPSGGVVTLDLATWGLPNPASLVVAPCASNSDVDCATAQRATASVPVSDVTPSVTWPTDTAVGQDDPPFDVTVADPGGGGRLDVAFVTGGGFVGGQEIARDGATTLDLPDGRHTAQVRRCDALRWVCTPLAGLSRDLVVRRTFGGYVYAQTRTTAPRRLPITLAVDAAGPFDADLTVRDAQGRLVSGVGGPLTGLRTSDGVVRATLDVRSLRTGAYDLGGTLTYQDPDVGTLTGPLEPYRLLVDATPPGRVSVRLSRASVYPAVDGYRDDLIVTTRVAGGVSGVGIRHQVLDRRGHVVASFDGSPSGVRFSGRSSTGRALSSGRYTLRTTAIDEVGNTTRGRSLTINVSGKRLRQHVYTRTVTAAGSLTGRNVGRCSTLKVGFVRGWRGGMSLRTATRCQGSISDTFVSTGHGLTAPVAFRYDSVSVTVVGGASSDEPRSQAYVSYLRRLGGYDGDTLLTPELRSHPGDSVRGATHVYDDGYVGWSVYTAAGSHYDVKGFTVRIGYTRLE